MEWQEIPATQLGKFDGTGMVAYQCPEHDYMTGVGRPDSHRLNEAKAQHEHAKHYDFEDEIRAFHTAADETDDVHDHDELHAAGKVLGSDPVWAETEPYIKRWLAGLRELHGIRPAD